MDKNHLFKATILIGALGVIVLLLAIFLSLLIYSIPSLMAFGIKFFFGKDWDPVSNTFGALPFLVFSFSTDAIAWSLASGALGVTVGTVFVQSSTYVAELAPEDKKSLYMAFFDSIIDYSFVIMPPIATYAYTYTPQAPFILCAFLLVIAAIIFTKA